MSTNRTAADVLQSVMAANHFRAEDLEANRKLELSPFQRQRLRTEVRRAMLVLAVCAAMVLSAVILPSGVTYGIAILGLMLGGFVGYFFLRWRRDPGTIARVDGLLSREERVTRGRRSAVTYRYRVSNKVFGVDQAAYYALARDIPVRAYYLVASQNLINLELLSEQVPESEREITARLPHTDF